MAVYLFKSEFRKSYKKGFISIFVKIFFKIVVSPEFREKKPEIV